MPIIKAQAAPSRHRAPNTVTAQAGAAGNERRYAATVRVLPHLPH